MSTVFLANRLRGWSASICPRWSMMRSAADFGTPNSGAGWRIVKFVRQYAATSSTGPPAEGSTGGPCRPRLQGGDQLLQQHIEDARQLAGVLRLCIEKDVPLALL